MLKGILEFFGKDFNEVLYDFLLTAFNTLLAIGISEVFYWLGNRNAFKQDVAKPLYNIMDARHDYHEEILECIKEKKAIYSYRYAPKELKKQLDVLEAAINNRKKEEIVFKEAILNGFCNALDIERDYIDDYGHRQACYQEYGLPVSDYLRWLNSYDQAEDGNRELKDLLIEFYCNGQISEEERRIVDSLDMWKIYIQSEEYAEYERCEKEYQEAVAKTKVLLGKLRHVSTEKGEDGKVKKKVDKVVKKSLIFSVISDMLDVYKTEDLGKTCKKLVEGILTSALIAAIFLGFLFLNMKIGNNEKFDPIIQRVIMPYFISVAGIIAGLLVLAFPYIWLERIQKPVIQKIVKALAVIVILAVILTMLPIWGVLGLVDIVIRNGARTVDNIQILGMLLAADIILVVTIFSICYEVPVILGIMEKISTRFGLKELPTTLFVIFAITELVIVLFNKFALKWYAKRHSRMNADGKEVIYDIAYLEGVLLKSQIMVLIIIYLVATFSAAEWIGDADTDLCNIVTVFTLVILYIDKAKEMKKKRDDIGLDEPIKPLREKLMAPEDEQGSDVG